MSEASPTQWQSSPTKIEGVRLIERPCFRDQRGQFSTLFHVKHPLEGVPTEWSQENLSISAYGVLRGMHLQVSKPQGKLVTCVAGVIWDCWIDMRPESPTYLKGEGIHLNSADLSSVYIPPGFAHGFLALSSVVSVHYKTTEPFIKEFDRAFRWDSPEMREMWPQDFEPILSEKDRTAPLLGEFLRGLG